MRHKLVVFLVLMALAAIFTGVQISTNNFNSHLAEHQQVEAFTLKPHDFDSVWQVALLDRHYQVDKQQISQWTDILTAYYQQLPTDRFQQQGMMWYIELSDRGATLVNNFGERWQQVINANWVESTRCWAENMLVKLKSKDDSQVDSR